MTLTLRKSPASLTVSEDILFFSFRYALHRRAASVTLVINALATNWSQLHQLTRQQIHDEIRFAMKSPEFCDVPAWEEVLGWYIEYPDPTIA